MSDFFKHIEQPTTQVNQMNQAPDFSLSAADFDQSAFAPPADPYPGRMADMPYSVPAPGTPGMLPAKEPEDEKLKVDAEFTSKFIISFFDGVQEPLFYHLNESRRRKKYFGSREKYSEAVELSYKTTEKIKEEHPDEADEKLELVARLHRFNARMEKVEKDIPFTADEKQKLKEPLKKLVEKSNFDIPPGIAMFMAACEVMSSRLIDLYAD